MYEININVLQEVEELREKMKLLKLGNSLIVKEGIEDRFVILSVDEYDSLCEYAAPYRPTPNCNAMNPIDFSEHFNLQLEQTDFDELKEVLMKYMNKKKGKK